MSLGNSLQSQSFDLKGPATVVTRPQWGALPAKHYIGVKHPVSHVICWNMTGHIQVTNKKVGCRVMREMQKQHQEIGYSDIIFNFVIFEDDLIFEGRGWNTCSAKFLKYNPEIFKKRLDIALIVENKESSAGRVMDEGKISLLDKGVTNNYINRFFNLIYLSEKELY